MAGIYIHIPFCKQACHYCDFHFSTSMKKKDEMVLALAKEIRLRKSEISEKVETIYFGGGTPSVLTNVEIEFLIQEVYQNFEVIDNPEITLEANPDDLSEERIIALSKTPINRLSIGVQSFFEEDLKLMNRAHNSVEAKRSLAVATQYFDNISVDLIYGIPGLTNEMWLENIETALSFGIPHVSSYALTVEPKTALHKLIQTGKINAPKDDVAQEHFEILTAQDRYNEYVMTGLRTIWGVSLERIEKEFGADYLTYLLQQGKKYIADGLLSITENVMRTTAKGKFLADGIASDLFKINQED